MQREEIPTKKITDMDKEKFSDLLLFRDYSEVETALKNGFNPNTPLEQDKPAIEWCSYSNDYRMMQILWSYGAKPTTLMTAEIIGEFEKGTTYVDYEQQTVNLNDYPDLTEEFSVEKLELCEGNIQLENNLYNITIAVSKFVLDAEIVETAISLNFIPLPKPLTFCIGETINFPINPEEGYIDGSIYLRNCHNPVDVTRLKFLKIENEKLIIEISMKFDFECENIELKNEELIKTIELEIC